MKTKRLKLINTIQLITFMSLFLMTIVIVVLQINSYRKEFYSQSEAMRMNFINQQKTMIKYEVERVVDMINLENVIHSSSAALGTEELNISGIERKMQQKVVDYVTKYRFGKQNQDYVFVLNLINIEGGKDFAIMYATANRPDIIGEYISDDFKDANGKEFRKEVLHGLREYGECYVNYWYKKIENSEPSPKTSYFKLSLDKQFIVAAGVYHDDVDSGIVELQKSLNNKLRKDITNTVLILGTLLLLILSVTYFIIRRLLADFSLFVNFFNQTVHENIEIDRSKIRFERFYQMAGDANIMLRDKKEAQHRLLEEKEQLAVTLRSIGDAVITVDLEGFVSLLNRVAEKLTGWSEKDAIGKPLNEIFKIINGISREKADNPVEKVLKREIVINLANNTVLVSKDKTEYNIEDSAAPIKNADSRIIGAVLVFRDVTTQLKREQELIQSKKLESIGVLAGGIAHDFNNLLTGFFGNIEMAKIHLSDDHEAYKFLDAAKQSMDRAINLTKQLLTFARGGDPITESISIGANIIETAQFSLRGSHVKLQTIIDSDLWPVEADKGQLSQVISNLVINAHQAMPDGGKISIGAKNTEMTGSRYVQITIQDEGGGIAAQHLDKIFDPYFSTKEQGHGLGLASTYSIINKHKGYIKVDSQLDKGTLFTILLPAAEKGEETVVGELSVENDSIRYLSAKILVLDDEEMVRDVVKAMLERMGYSISFAVDGQEAVIKYQVSYDNGSPYDIVIMDLTIPGGMGGQEAAQKILKIEPDAKIIVSSGYATDPVMANYESFGFKGIAEKPYSFEELKNVIFNVLEM